MCKNKNCLHIYICIIVFIEPCIIILQYIIFIYPRIVWFIKAQPLDVYRIPLSTQHFFH